VEKIVRPFPRLAQVATCQADVEQPGAFRRAATVECGEELRDDFVLLQPWLCPGIPCRSRRF
jgi:hypothetical protein